MAEGRYLVRGGEPEQGQSVLVIEILGAAPLPRRRRRRARPAEPSTDTPQLPLSRATAVRAAEPFERREDAEGWLQATVESEEAVDEVLAEGIGLLNRALFAQAAAVADPRLRELTPGNATAIRIGFGSGEEVAGGRYSEARHVDPSEAGGTRRRKRAEELRPQERVAAVLGGRERVDACEPLLLRARADLDAGRLREAALQLQVGLAALLVELDGAVADPGHGEDMAELQARREEAGAAATAAILGELDAEGKRTVRELTEISERVLRRRRVMRGG